MQKTSQALEQRRQYIKAYRAVHVQEAGFANSKKQYRRIDREFCWTEADMPSSRLIPSGVQLAPVLAAADPACRGQ
jgi:hypothetical protein